MEDLGRLAAHLRLGDPERRLRDGDGEVVDLDAPELRERDLDGQAEVELALPALARGDETVLEATQTDVGLREEVARPARRIEEGEGGEPVLERRQPPVPFARGRGGEDRVEFRREAVEEERTDDFVDVRDGRVDHAARAARLGVQGRLEERAEDGGRDLAPVEARRAEEELADLLRERRDVVKPARRRWSSPCVLCVLCG